jgi:hypothetical protein
MIKYTAIDSDGNEVKPDKSLQGKTELQQLALEACKQSQFTDRDQRETFKDYEEKASPIKRTHEGMYEQAWLRKCIEEVAVLNKRVRNYDIDDLFNRFGNLDKRDAWLTDEKKLEIRTANRTTVNPTAATEVKLKSATALPRPAYVPRLADHVAAVIAKFEDAFSVNIRYNTSNTEHARLIWEDGRDIDTFIRWAKSHEYWSDKTEAFKSLAKVWELWPKAFNAEENGMNPQGLSIA